VFSFRGREILTAALAGRRHENPSGRRHKKTGVSLLTPAYSLGRHLEARPLKTWLVRSGQGPVGGGLGVYGANAGPNRLRQQADVGQILGRQLGLYAAGMWRRITNSDTLSRFVTA
jgi:hypothetical protein